MSVLFAIAIGALVSASVYLFLARDLPRMLIGFIMLGTTVNLAILASGRIGSLIPALIPDAGMVLPDGAANPLPQALILTAIVIGFGLAAFSLMLIVKAKRVLGTVRPEEMHDAEGPESDPPVQLPPRDEMRRNAA